MGLNRRLLQGCTGPFGNASCCVLYTDSLVLGCIGPMVHTILDEDNKQNKGTRSI